MVLLQLQFPAIKGMQFFSCPVISCIVSIAFSLIWSMKGVQECKTFLCSRYTGVKTWRQQHHVITSVSGNSWSQLCRWLWPSQLWSIFVSTTLPHFQTCLCKVIFISFASQKWTEIEGRRVMAGRWSSLLTHILEINLYCVGSPARPSQSKDLNRVLIELRIHGLYK